MVAPSAMPLMPIESDNYEDDDEELQQVLQVNAFALPLFLVLSLAV